MKLRKWCAWLCILTLTLSLVACGNSVGNMQSNGNSDTSAEANDETLGETYKFVLYCPLTGNNAQYGQTYRTTCELLVEKVNSEGGINGHPVILEVYDDKNDPKEAVNIAARVVSDDSVLGVVGSQTSTTSMAAGPTYQEAGIVMISPQASHPDYSAIGDYMFRCQSTTEYEFNQVAKYMANTLGIKNLAIIYGNDDAGNGANENLTESLAEYGVKVSVAETFVPTATKDFSPILSKVKEANPDYIFFFGSYTDGANVLKQARAQGIDTPYFGSNMQFTQAFIDVAGEDAEGVLVENTLALEYDEGDFNWLQDAYFEVTGNPIDTYVTQSYDALNLLIKAVEKVGPDRAAIRDEIAATKDFPGVAGTFSFDENRNPEKPVFIFEIQNGEFVQIGDCEN